jgi:chromosome segregation ATPase
MHMEAARKRVARRREEMAVAIAAAPALAARVAELEDAQERQQAELDALRESLVAAFQAAGRARDQLAPARPALRIVRDQESA